MTKKTNERVDDETKLVKQLAKILNDTDLSEIEMEKGDLKIRVARKTEIVSAQYTAPAPAPAPAQAAVADTNAAAPATKDMTGAVTSPMVGTVYCRPNPDSDPFFAVGQAVKAGDTVLLIEAMKTFNPIKAASSGVVKEVFVEDGQAVEYGEPLMIIG